MLGTLGFSYIGLIYLLMLWLPNILWAWRLPKGYSPAGENKALLILERVGQASCTASILIFSDYNPQILEPRITWFITSLLLMLFYEASWLRYFKSDKTVNDFYRSFFRIPAPGAVLPVAAFFLLGIYGKVIWLMIASVILGVGHIGIHLQHIKNLKNDANNTNN